MADRSELSDAAATTASQNGPVPTQEHLIGRDAELAAIRDLVASATRDGGVLLLRGDPGIGKSSLLEQGVEAARSGGVRVVRVTGVRTEAHLAFAGLHQLLRPLLGGLDALPPPQRSALASAFGLTDGAAQDPFLISLAALTLLTDAAADRPILIVVDDVQWLDRPTEDVLGFVARRLGSDPIALLGACRGGDWEAMVETTGLPLLELEPLDEAASRELLLQRASALRAPDRERILRESAGNPLALVELASAIEDRTPISSVSSDPLPVTARIERAFVGRIANLPEPTETLLLLAALDDQARIDEILAAARLLGRADPSVADLTPAFDAELLTGDDWSIRFRHPLIRSATAQRASAADRRASHAALADVVADPDRVAWHRAAALTHPDETAAALLEAAADRAERRGALGVAVSSLERAIALSPDGQSRGARMLRATDLAYGLGRLDLMARLVEEAEPLDVAALEDRRRAWRSALRLNGAKTAREAPNIRAVIDAAERIGGEDIDFAMTLLQQAAARSWWMDMGAELWTRLLQVADRLVANPDDPRVLYIRSAARDRPADVVERVRRRLESPDTLEPDSARTLGTAAMWAGDLDAASQLFAACVGVHRDQGRIALIARGQVLRGWCAAMLGNFADAGPALDEGLRLAVETNQENFVATANFSLTVYHALRGELGLAAATLAEDERHGRHVYADGLLGHIQFAKGLLELAAGRPADAFDSLRHLYEPGDEGHHSMIGSWAIPELVDAAIPAGRAAEATRYLDALASDASLVTGPLQRKGLAYARAVLAAEREDHAAAESAFAAALAMDLERWPLPRARLLLAYGTWLRRRRRIAESRDPLRSARDLLDAIGVPWLADRARQELGAAGEISGVRQPRSVDDLTPQELQIAQLAARGLSNREIGEQLYVSHRTVGFHLYHVYPKLGISGRAQLHAALGAA